MKLLFFKTALDIHKNNPAIAQINKARLACFKAGLTSECDSITKKLIAKLREVSGCIVVRGQGPVIVAKD